MGKRKSENNLIRVFFLFFLVVCFAAFIISAYKILTITLENRKADTSYSEIRDMANAQHAAAAPEEIAASSGNEASGQRKKSVEVLPLQQDHPQMRAWLFAEGTSIDYPVMQAQDNDYYMTHLYDGSVNQNGSIFVDYRNSGVLTDDNTVIYGHNMQSGAMFNVLNEYKSQEFFETHPTMIITTAEGDYLLELICGTIEDGNYEFVKFRFGDFREMSDYVEKLRSRSTFVSNVELEEGDKLVSLCTCTYENQNARYMLVGRAVELYS